MSKQKIKTIEHTVIHPTAERVGALMLTALSILVTFEAIVEHSPSLSSHHDTDRVSVSEIFARGEAKGETARLPEEFDIGLQTPHITGV